MAVPILDNHAHLELFRLKQAKRSTRASAPRAQSIGLLKETMSVAATFGGALVLLAIYLVAETGIGEKEPVKSA